jgi:hypothetical protein
LTVTLPMPLARVRANPKRAVPFRRRRTLGEWAPTRAVGNDATRWHDTPTSAAGLDASRWAIVVLCLGWFAPVALGAPQALAPAADGTIADGGGFGNFDGVGDAADWTFNESGYEGAITLARNAVPPFEYRVVFKYDLAAAAALPAVTATLAFALRGTTRFPAEPTPVEVVAFPSDLSERIADFAAGPTEVVATRWMAPLQDATTYTINVSVPVQDALRSGSRGIGFRFQVASYAAAFSEQAFLDAMDADPGTKPALSLSARLPGDLDADGDVDLADYDRLHGCLLGPGTNPSWNCVLGDLDSDSDVDLRDCAFFARLMPTPASP